MQAHAHTLRLLVDDLAEIPVRWLEEAARKWAISKAFLPKASELIMMARECREESRRSNPSDTIDGETMAQRGNRLMNAANYDRGVRWYEDGKGGAFLGFLPDPTSGSSRAPAQETDHSGAGEL